MNFQLYGLLHLEDSEKTSMNLVTGSFQEQVEIYARNAVTLSNSLRNKGVRFTLLTNKKNAVENALRGDSTLWIEEIPFVTNVPSGADFYSAHYKLDAFRYFSKRKGGYVGLCDLDMVCINDVPQCLIHNIKKGIPMCYDISDQVIPAYSHEVIIRDLTAVSGAESEGRWSGGEFITGTPGFFSRLIKGIDKIYGRYVKNIGKLHHVSDEMLTSASLERIRGNGEYVADAGTLGIVGRYWKSDILHVQRPFESYKGLFLLHLPGDKRFLAKMADKNPDSRAFIKMYSAHANSFYSIAEKLIHHFYSAHSNSFSSNAKKWIHNIKSKVFS
jgi:hypothetical protein